MSDSGPRVTVGSLYSLRIEYEAHKKGKRITWTALAPWGAVEGSSAEECYWELMKARPR